MIAKLLKLARMVLNLAQVETKEGVTLIADGELEVGKDVFVENEEQELVAAPDGEYTTEERIYVVVDGKIAEIRDVEEAEPENQPEPEPEPESEPEEVEQADEEEPAQEPEQEPEPDEKDAEIARLQAQIEELNNIIAEKDEEIGKLKAELEKSDAQPAEEQLKSQKEENKSWFKPRF